MNTRFKVLSVLLIFALSFVILYIFLSPDGLMRNSALKKEIVSVEEKVREKEGDVKSLRRRTESTKNAEDTREKELVYSFSDEAIFDPVTSHSVEGESTAAHYLETPWILVMALSITLLYSLIIFLFIPLIKRRRKGVRNY